MFRLRRTAFYPVAVIAVKHAVDVAHFSTVNMAANHAVVAATFGFLGHRHFKVSDVIQRTIDFLLEVRRQGPAQQAHARGRRVQVAVDFERDLMEVVAGVRFEKVQQRLGLVFGDAQMQIADEDGAKAPEASFISVALVTAAHLPCSAGKPA